MINILLVEDDQELRRLFSAVLGKQRYQIFEAAHGEEALDILDREHISLVVTDVMMPRMDGYQLVGLIRKMDKELPILMITAKGEIADKQEGFRLGIDDYMVKPIDVTEMGLRGEALLRRARVLNERKLIIGETQLLYDELKVKFSGKVLELPQKEFYLLFKLLSYPNYIFTRQQLMDEIWGIDVETETRTIDVHINRLRDRFKENSDFEIVTVRGLGYKAVKSDEK